MVLLGNRSQFKFQWILHSTRRDPLQTVSMDIHFAHLVPEISLVPWVAVLFCVCVIRLDG